MSSIRPRNHMHILVLVGAVAIIGLFMPLFTGGGNVPTGDAIVLIETAFQIISNSTSNEFNATADQEKDILQLLAGPGMKIDVNGTADTITFTSTGAGGGETNLGANVGGATGEIFRDKTGVTLNFKTVSSAGDGIVITNNADTVGLSLNNIPKSEISLTGTWVAADLPATVVYSTDNVAVLADVVGGCSDGQVLKWQNSNSTWICGTDNSGGAGDAIQEGDTNVETIDLGTGQVDVDIDGANEYRFNSTDFIIGSSNQIAGSMGCGNGQILEYSSASGKWECGTDDASGSSDIITEGDSNAEIIDLGTGQFDIDLDGANEYRFNSTDFIVGATNQIAGSMGCLNGEILEYSSASGKWECGADDTGGGSNALLDGSVHTDTVAQTVSRGSLIYGDATPNWNELVIGGSGTILKSDGTDVSWGTGTLGTEVTGASTSLTDTGDIAYLNTANTFADGNDQVFRDDHLKIFDTDNTHNYIISTGNIAADATISIPVFTGTETVVMTTLAQTLTQKTIALGSNSITGTAAEFDTALTANNFVFESDNVAALADVAGGCSDGQVLKFQNSNSTWICGTDISGGAGDIITEGDSNVEVIDAGTGQVDIDIDNTNEYIFTGTQVDLNQNNIVDSGSVSFDDTNTSFEQSGSNLLYDVATGGLHDIRVNDASEFTFNATDLDVNTNTLKGSMGCTNGQILEYNSGTDRWACGTDDASGSSDTITEGDSNVEVIDLGTGQIDIDIDGANEYWYNATVFDMNTNVFGGSMGCSNGQILEYNSGADRWQCGADDTGGGSNALLDGSVHTDTVAQTVSRGSLIYGDATPNWNELIIGGANTMLVSDGTDVSWGTGTIGSHVTGASTALTDTANIAYLNTANSYVDGNAQTFTDDDLEISNPAGTFQYIISTGAIGADATISLPVFTGTETMVLTTLAQTLTTKSIALGSNTITGSTTEFDTALTADNFAFEGESNSWADGVKQTFNPDATNAGINVGQQAGEPSTPVIGDIFYDSTANQFKGRDNTAWVNLGQGGGATDIIQEGDSNVEVIDAGTGQVDIDIDGINQITISGTQVDFTDNELINVNSTGYNVDAALSPTHAEGLTWYDQSEHALVTYNDEAEITQQLGQESYIRVYNNGGVTINNGAVVYISGSEGTEFRPTIALAQSNTLTTSEVIGVATHDIEASTFGYVTAFGLVNDFDTSAFTAGDPVYLSPTVAGALTATIPAAPNYDVLVGYIVRSDVSAGKLLVNLNPDLTSAGGDASEIVFSVEKDTAGTINPGDAVYIAGYDNGATITTVELADASAASTMPALGIARTTITDTAAGEVVIAGTEQMDTSSWSAGQEIYISNVGTTGNTLTNVKPTGTDLIQKIGIVARSHGSLGILEITGAGRTNDIPNVFVAEPSVVTLTAGGAMLAATNAPTKALIDAAFDYVVADFDTTTSEAVTWVFEMPDNMDSTADVVVTIHFQVNAGTAGVCWDAQFGARAPGEAVATLTGTEQGACDATTGANQIEEAVITFTSANHGIAAGDTVFFYLDRDVADATDTNANDARLISAMVEWS